MTRSADRWCRRFERAASRFGSDRAAAILTVGLVAFAVSAAVSLLVRWPVPVVQDEFSYLLAADTFAHGRLSNVTHPLWVYFESIHILQVPTYCSKYPPGQGLILAAGQVMTGYPLVGVWLSTALACAAICWMLMGWMSPRWAFLGGLLAVLHPTVLLWSQTYWGGSIAALGGALILGGLRRVMVNPRTRDAVVMGLGAAVLANSRPYEGLVLCLISAASMIVRQIQWPSCSCRTYFSRAILPAMPVLVIALAAMGYYNLQTTGNVLRLPYVIHEQTYGVAPLFVWQGAKPEPVYRHAAIRDAHLSDEFQIYDMQRSAGGFVYYGLLKIVFLCRTAFPSLQLLLPLVAMPWVLRNGWMKFGILLCSLFVSALLAETWIHPHYAAPISGMVVLFEVQALRQLRLWQWRGRAAGRLLFRTSLAMCLVGLLPFCIDRSGVDDSNVWTHQLVRRAQIVSRLERERGQHVVVVRYSRQHDTHAEWVYNEADIDRAKVVWAREMQPEQNRLLLDYFRGRSAWLLEVDSPSPRLVPYPRVGPKESLPRQANPRQ